MKQLLHKLWHFLGLDYPCTIGYLNAKSSKAIMTCKKCGFTEIL